MLAEKQSLQRWAIVQLSLLWSSCWISPLINTAVCAGEVKGFRSASFSVTHRPFLSRGGAVLLLKGCDVHVRQAESLWNFTRHFTSGADCTWVLQSPVTEEGTFQRLAQSQILLQALALGCCPLMAMGIKGNKTSYVIWHFGYQNVGSVNVKAVKTTV